MTSREKFLNIFDFKADSPVLNWEIGYWYDTILKWYDQGLPKKNPIRAGKYGQFIPAEALTGQEQDIHEYFNADEGTANTGVITGPYPPFHEKVIQEDVENIIIRRGDGKTIKTRKDGTSMPTFLEYPVKTEKDFEDIKERFIPDDEGRLKDDWAGRVKDLNSATGPVRLGGGKFCGFYSIIREMVGTENSLFMFYDNPNFARRILDFFLDYYIKLYTWILSMVNVDYIMIWEDMAFKNGPLISPDTFREFILPCYKKFTDAMRSLGVDKFVVDTDGNFEALIPLFLEGGVTGIYPFEVAAGMDVEKTRKEYPELIIFGGVDKRSLNHGREAIDIELSKIERMLKKGGYQPYTDHAVPPDVDFDDYVYYRNGLIRLIEKQIKG